MPATQAQGKLAGQVAIVTGGSMGETRVLVPTRMHIPIIASTFYSRASWLHVWPRSLAFLVGGVATLTLSLNIMSDPTALRPDISS